MSATQDGLAISVGSGRRNHIATRREDQTPKTRGGLCLHRVARIVAKENAGSNWVKSEREVPLRAPIRSGTSGGQAHPMEKGIP